MQKNVLATYIVSLFLFSALCACSGEKSNAQSAKQANDQSVEQVGNADVLQSAATGCDASLWNHVYTPTRLQQLSPCISVTGVIEESSADDDGDQHFLLKMDPGQDRLLNKRNQKKKSGDIVLEIVCANSTTMKKAKSACAGFTNRVSIPAVGAHVRATGTYVIDSHNGWAEIHPVARMDRL